MTRSIRRLTSAGAVLQALELYDELGAEEFLARHGFGRPYRYQLVHGGRDYDSKAVAGVAFGFQYPHLGPLRSTEFSGGTSGAAEVLRSLGFDIRTIAPRPAAASPRTERAAVAAPMIALRTPEPNVPIAADEVGLDEVEAAVAVLADLQAAHSPRGFPWGRSDLAAPGLYAWHVDEEGARHLSTGLQVDLRPGLVYAGQAGATAWPSGTRRSSTLLSRIGSNHLRGRISASTWRLSLTAVLRDQLSLELVGGELAPPSQIHLTEWMSHHLRLNVYPVIDRDGLSVLEHAVLAWLDPPLNLDGMASTRVRVSLAQLRAEITRSRPARIRGGTGL